MDQPALPVYGTEHLLHLKRVNCEGDDDQQVQPVLLRYREGERLENLARVAA